MDSGLATSWRPGMTAELVAAPSARTRWTWLLCAAVAIAALPLVFQDLYWRGTLIIAAVNVILAIGLDFILGYAGQLNLGHSAFYGIGAYVSTLLIMLLGMPFWIAFVLGILASGAAGAVLSIFAVRLRGHYLAIASLGFAVIVHQVLLNWISLTQGPLGIYGIKPPPPVVLPGLGVISFSDSANMLYLVAAFAFFFYLVLDALVRSPIGEALTAIREDEYRPPPSASTARPGRYLLSASARPAPAPPERSTLHLWARSFPMLSPSRNPSPFLPW